MYKPIRHKDLFYGQDYRLGLSVDIINRSLSYDRIGTCECDVVLCSHWHLFRPSVRTKLPFTQTQ